MLSLLAIEVELVKLLEDLVDEFVRRKAVTVCHCTAPNNRKNP